MITEKGFEKIMDRFYNSHSVKLYRGNDDKYYKCWNSDSHGFAWYTNGIGAWCIYKSNILGLPYEQGNGDGNTIAKMFDGNAKKYDFSVDKKSLDKYIKEHNLRRKNGFVVFSDGSMQVAYNAKLLYDMIHACDTDTVSLIEMNSDYTSKGLYYASVECDGIKAWLLPVKNIDTDANVYHVNFTLCE